MPQNDDARLLQDCLGGRPGAWEAFTARFRPYLAEVCRRTLSRCGQPSGPPEVEDLIQEVFVLFLEDDLKVLRAWRGKSTVATYLAAVAAHRAMDEKGLPAAGALPEELAAADVREPELAEKLRLEMARLPLRDRLALTLQTEGATIGEIAGALRLSEAAVAKALSRAKAQLRERLK